MRAGRWVRDIRVYCPVAPATLAALLTGKPDAIERDQTAAALLAILRTPPLLAALVNPRLPTALARADVKDALISSLQGLIQAVEEQEKEAREAKERAAREAANPPPADALPTA